jgi:hypothetical protein
VAEPEPDLARLRPLFLLEKLSWRLRSDVLADGSIISACGFSPKRPAQLTDDIVVNRDELFAAFRNASKIPVTCQLHDLNDALVDATVSVGEDGSGTVEIAGKKISFPWITLLSSDADKRLAQLDHFLHRYPLSDGDAASLRARVARPDFSDDDFRAAATLFESSPKIFTERLADKVRRHEGEDVLPDDDRYWNHLLPQLAGSMTLADYIGHELNAAWGDGLKADSVRALHGLGITFAAPELVPRAPLRALDADAVANAIEAVVGIHLIVRNSRFARALDILFESFERDVRPWTFKLRNPRSRRGQPWRARRNASSRTDGRPAADGAPCRPCLLRLRRGRPGARRANEAARMRSPLC